MGNGPPFRGSAIPGVRHSGGLSMARVTVRVNVRVREWWTPGMVDFWNGGPKSPNVPEGFRHRNRITKNKSAKASSCDLRQVHLVLLDGSVCISTGALP